MTITSSWEIKCIREYAELLKKRYELQEKLSAIHDEMINLSVFMTNDDINEANELFEEMMSKDEYN